MAGIYGGKKSLHSSNIGVKQNGRDLTEVSVDHHVHPWTWLPNTFVIGTLYYAAIAVMAVVDMNQKHTVQVWKWGVFTAVLCAWYAVVVLFSVLMHSKMNSQRANPAPAHYLNSYWIHCYIAIAWTAIHTATIWAFWATFEDRDHDIFETRYYQPAPTGLDDGMMRLWYTNMGLIVVGFMVNLKCQLDDMMRPPSAFQLSPYTKEGDL